MNMNVNREESGIQQAINGERLDRRAFALENGFVPPDGYSTFDVYLLIGDELYVAEMEAEELVPVRTVPCLRINDVQALY